MWEVAVACVSDQHQQQMGCGRCFLRCWASAAAVFGGSWVGVGCWLGGCGVRAAYESYLGRAGPSRRVVERNCGCN